MNLTEQSRAAMYYGFRLFQSGVKVKIFSLLSNSIITGCVNAIERIDNRSTDVIELPTVQQIITRTETCNRGVLINEERQPCLFSYVRTHKRSS